GLETTVLPPTALTRMSMRPNSFSTAATVSFTAASSSASHNLPCACPPAYLIEATASSSAPWRLSTPTTMAPSRAMISAVALPMRHPLPLAKELSTLHNLSGGRLILGVGVGWLEPEFAALGVPFNERGRRMDEGIAMMRAVWSQDPVNFEAKHIPAKIEDMTMLPQPVSPIPMWHGSRSEAAHRRTVRVGDGWHGSQV